MRKSIVPILYVALVGVLATVGIVFAQNTKGDSRVRNISGGSEIEITATPWQVSMLSIDPDSADANPENSALWRISGCGGSIIAPSWILTADHCVKRGVSGELRPEYQLIGVGNKDFWPSLEDPYLFRVSAIYPARQNKDGVDLLLLKLSKQITYSNTARSIALPVAMDATTWPVPGTEGTISGWGQVLGGTQTTKLRAVNSPIVDSPTSFACTDLWGISRFDGTYSSQRHICVRGITFEGDSAGACPGDSGGPLAVTVDGTPTLAGVASMALGVRRTDGSVNNCTGFLPNLYARLRSHIEWVIPGAPQSLQVRVANTSATVSWAPAARVPALATNDYVVELRVKGAPNFETLNDGLSDKPSATLASLQNNTQYELRVAGINAVNQLEPGNRMYSDVSTFTVGVVSPALSSTTSTTASTSTSTTASPSTSTTASTSTSTTSPPGISVVTVPQPVVKNVPNLPAFENIPTGTAKTAVPATQQRSQDLGSLRSPLVGASMTSTDVARVANVVVPKGSQVSIVVARSSAKNCSSNGVVVKFTALGKCKLGIFVRSRGKQSKPTNATLVVKRK